MLPLFVKKTRKKEDKGRIRNKDARRLNKLVRKAGSVTGARLDTLVEVAERCTGHPEHLWSPPL